MIVNQETSSIVHAWHVGRDNIEHFLLLTFSNAVIFQIISYSPDQKPVDMLDALQCSLVSDQEDHH